MLRLRDLSGMPSRIRSLVFSHALASVALIASLLLVLWYWKSAQERGVEEERVAFLASSEEAAELLRQRLLSYELLVRGGASLQASLPQPNRALWQQYVAGLDIDGRFPSVQSLGFALAVDPRQLGALQGALPGMTADAATDADASTGTSAIVLYLSSEDADGSVAVGTNLAKLANQREVMQRAASTGNLLMTAPQAETSEQGLLDERVSLFAPVYAGGIDIQPTQRKSALRGWVFARIDVDAFIRDTLRAHEHSPRMRVVDVSDPEPQVIHLDEGFITDPARVQDSAAPAFNYTGELDVMGRRWHVEFQSPPMAEVQAGIPGLTATLISGLLATALIVSIAFTLARTQSRANMLAERMTQSYRRSEHRFRSAMRYSAIGKALLDADGNIVDANPALEEILGNQEGELLGTSLWEHFVDGHDNALKTTERETMSSEGVYRTTRRLRRKDGDVRHASLVFSEVPGKTDSDFASLVQVEDVTERLRAEARVQALNRTLEARVAMRTRELSQANQELESFAYSVSHDLRAPLRSIDGFSRLLSERYGADIDEGGQDYLQRIRNATHRMSELIDALLKMSRVSRGELKYERVDLGQVAQTVAAELDAASEARHVVLEVEDDLQASGDAALLRNLMANLLGNAWKFTQGREDARIRVGRNQAGEFFVQDNGAGFSPEYAQKLFRPFQRLHTQEEFPGHGIGLATVKRIVERHSGSLRAEGVAGEGATFYFMLPDEPDQT